MRPSFIRALRASIFPSQSALFLNTLLTGKPLGIEPDAGSLEPTVIV